jgi:TRAP-type C4-dicarboxylate transport system substrate-binding protein
VKKKLLIGLIVLALLAVPLYATACAEEAPPPPPPPEVFELKYSDHGTAKSASAPVINEWLDRIEQRSGGRVKITRYWSSSLLKSTDVMRGVQTGVADIASYVMGMNPGVNQLNLFVNLPMMGFPGADEAAAIYKEVYNKFPEMEEDMGGVKVIAISMFQAYQLHTAGKQVKVPADLAGMRMISEGPDWAAFYESVGATPVEMGPGDFYLSMEKGLVQGWVVLFAALDFFNMIELCDYHTILGGSGASMGMGTMIMNLDTFNSLPADIQQIILEEGEWYQQQMHALDAEMLPMIMGKVEAAGNTVYEVTPEEFQLWQEAFAFTHENWIAETEAQGWPGREVYDEVMRLIAEY